MKVNNVVEKIYLFVGSPKTGSTSIQRTFCANKKLLEKFSIFYPKNLLPNDHNEIGDIFQMKEEENNNLKNIYKDLGNSKKYRLEELKKILQNELQNCKVERFCLVGEMISYADKYALNKLRNFLLSICPFAQITVFYCVREYGWLCNSNVQELIFAGNSLSLIVPWNNPHKISYLKKRTGVNYKYFIEILKDVFRNDNMVVYQFEDACEHEYGPVGFLLMLMGLTIEDLLAIKFVKTNEARSDKCIDLIAFINRKCPVFLKPDVPNPKRSKQAHLPIAAIRGNKFTAGNDAVKHWRYLYSGDAVWLKENYCIDYTQSKTIANDPKIMIFKNDYYDDIIKLFPKLCRIFRSLVYDYCVEAPKHYGDKESNLTFKALQEWIASNISLPLRSEK